jgi:putative hydrolase of the HAD superfamily
MFEMIAFDADDTLWHNERYYRMGRERFHALMAKYQIQEKLDERLDEIEIGNLSYYGYSAMGFVLSLMETAVELTEGQVSGEEIQQMILLLKEMLTHEVQLFDGVEETLARLSGSYPLMLITKGTLLHQQSKVEQSGLKRYFQHIEVVSDKTPETYSAVLARHNIKVSSFMMVGNSLRSDILPVLQLGGWAAYIPYDLTWSHEHTASPDLDGVRHRYFEVQHLTHVPGLIEGLT